MSGVFQSRLELTLLMLAAIGFLFVAYKWGLTGGGGGVAYKHKNPINFWLGVAINVLVVLGCIAALVDSFVRPGQFRM